METASFFFLGGEAMTELEARAMQQAQISASACACLLQDKSADGELAKAFESLAAERHAHFHTKAESRSGRAAEMYDWKKCVNPICVAAQKLLIRCASAEITITPFMAQRAGAKRVKFEQMPDGLNVSLADPELIERPRIIIP